MGPRERANENVLEFTDRRAPLLRELILGALDACHDALRHELQVNGGGIADKSIESWRKPVVAFAVFASRHGVPPERVVVMLKKMVSEMAPVQHLPPQERNTMVQRFLAVAVDAYYRA